MRWFVAASVLVVSSAAAAGPKVATKPVKAAATKHTTTLVTVTINTNMHCGGTRIRDGEDIYQHTPAEGHTYLVRRGKTNKPGKVIAEATTDSLGQLSLDLPRGTYCLITPDKRDVTAPNAPIPPGAIPIPPKGPPLGIKGDLGGIGGRSASTGPSEEEMRVCDLVLVAPTTKATLNIYQSSCGYVGKDVAIP